MMQINDLYVEVHHKKILDKINFQIEEGHCTMLLGENGSGKTTLMKTLLGLLDYQGEIVVQNQNIKNYDEKKRSAIFSYVPQIKEIVQDMRLEDCIVSGRNRFLSIFDTPSTSDYKHAYEIMEKFKLSNLKGRALHEISGGELQMTYVARAFLQDAQYMLMDEPCTYLDYQRQYHFLQMIKEITNHNTSVFLSIHDPNLALQYADEIIILHDGKVHAHIKKKEQNIHEELCKCYNELYGNHFVLIGDKETKFIVWKGDLHVTNTTICESK